MYAIIATGGKQIRVEEGRYVDIEKVPVDEGGIVEFDQVLLVAGEALKVGTPTVADAKVIGRVLRQWKSPKVVVYKMRPKKHYRRKRGHRQLLSRVLIESIKV